MSDHSPPPLPPSLSSDEIALFLSLNEIAFVVMAVYVPCSAVLYYTFRDLRNIKGHRPILTIIAQTSIAVCWLTYIAQEVNAVPIPIWALESLCRGLGALGIDIYIVMALHLYISFNVAMSRLQWAQKFGGAMRKKSIWQQHYTTFLYSKSIMQSIIGFGIVTSILPSLYVLVAYPIGELSKPSLHCNETSEVCRLLGTLAMIRYSVRVFALVIVTMKIRVVRDVLGIKARLNRLSTIYMIAFVLLTGVFLITQTVDQFAIFIGTIFININFYREIVRPVMKVLRGRDHGTRPVEAWLVESKVSNVENGVKLLGDYLRTSRGLHSFSRHMVLELATENVKFVAAVDKFRKDFDKALAKTSKGNTILDRLETSDKNHLGVSAVRIYRSFILRSGSMRLPITSKLRHKMAHAFDESASMTMVEVERDAHLMMTLDLKEGHVFDPVRTFVLELMVNESLNRYLRQEANRNLWQEFLTARDQPDFRVSSDIGSGESFAQDDLLIG